MKEQRKFIRFETDIKVDYYPEKGPRVIKTGHTKNVSVGGMELVTEDKLELGNQLELIVFIPDAKNPAHLNGEVVWVKENPVGDKSHYSAGIEFGRIEEDNKTTLLAFLCDLMSEKIQKAEKLGAGPGQVK